MQINRRNLLLLLGSSVVGMGLYNLFKEQTMKMPVLFFGHGSPMNAISDNAFTKKLNEISKNYPTPKAIVIVSAHWETNGTWVTGMDKPKTIHDFYGFPQELFDVQYSAPGKPDLALDLKSSISVPDIGIDQNWGLDHGSWSILKHLYPDANIPVIQLSLDKTKPFSYHFELGQKLNYLRERGVLIIGSGNIVHNLRRISWKEDASVMDWAQEFDQWIKSKADARDFNALVNDPLKSTAGKLSIPTAEHYLPLLYILGASDPKDQLVYDIEEIQNGSIAMRSFRFG